jgi:hypothetical protein
VHNIKKLCVGKRAIKTTECISGFSCSRVQKVIDDSSFRFYVTTNLLKNLALVAECYWLIPIVPATWEAGDQGWWLKASLGK